MLKPETATVFEFGHVGRESDKTAKIRVPDVVFAWLEDEAARNNTDDKPTWLKTVTHGGKRAVQFAGYVGVVREPKTGYQIEILPKVGRVATDAEARGLLVSMLRCLHDFRHVPIHDAGLDVARMPLIDVFIRAFLVATEKVVKRGLRRDYVAEQGNVFALRGKFLIAQHLRDNLIEKDRFFTEHDEFTPNRPENRLLHAALNRVSVLSQSMENQRLARELRLVFDEVPEPTSATIATDIKRIRLDRGMAHYESALSWAKLLLNYLSPTATTGISKAPSLLFPMNALFEAYVEKHLARQLKNDFTIRRQASSEYLVKHNRNDWFQLKPDMLIKRKAKTEVVVDAKWKLINEKNVGEKYKLSQGDFYQMFAYGKRYLKEDENRMVLIYPKTSDFKQALDEFVYEDPLHPLRPLHLWVLPFCLEHACLEIPDQLKNMFSRTTCEKCAVETCENLKVA